MLLEPGNITSRVAVDACVREYWSHSKNVIKVVEIVCRYPHHMLRLVVLPTLLLIHVHSLLEFDPVADRVTCEHANHAPTIDITVSANIISEYPAIYY